MEWNRDRDRNRLRRRYTSNINIKNTKETNYTKNLSSFAESCYADLPFILHLMDLRHVQRGKYFPLTFFHRFLSFNFHFMYFFACATYIVSVTWIRCSSNGKCNKNRYDSIRRQKNMLSHCFRFFYGFLY